MLDFDFRKVPSGEKLPKTLYVIVFFWAFYWITTFVIALFTLIDVEDGAKGPAILMTLLFILSGVVFTLFSRLLIENYVMTTEIAYLVRRLDWVVGMSSSAPFGHPDNAVPLQAQSPAEGYQSPAAPSAPSPPPPQPPAPPPSPPPYPPTYPGAGEPPTGRRLPYPYRPNITWGGKR